jgi:arylsulfatase A-like enzyme
MADGTIVVFTSDHGDLLGAHGGLQQGRADEAIRVPLLVKGPGVASAADGLAIPTSHVDLIPTLLGLAGIDVEAASAEVARTHTQTRPLVGRDLIGVLAGTTPAAEVAGPIYFMTDDDVTRGLTQRNVLTGESFESLSAPHYIESVIATLPTGADGAAELWKLNHYHDGLEGWHDGGTASVEGADGPVWELHNLTADPEERHDRSAELPDTTRELQAILEQERDQKRLLPS